MTLPKSSFKVKVKVTYCHYCHITAVLCKCLYLSESEIKCLGNIGYLLLAIGHR